MDIDWDLLYTAARDARERSYSPYSRFKVGAALLTADGTVVTGCNVENRSYGLTICAERSAVFKAVSEGVRSFSAIAISLPGGGSPCGACRQVLHEFNSTMNVYLADETGAIVRETSLEALFPDPFGPGNLS